jgi:Fe-S-cluster containining protein
VTPPVARRVRALSIHAGYRCRHTGVCCSSGWDVPVEREMHLRNALASGRLRIPEAAVTSTLPGANALLAASCFRPVPGLPHGARVVFSSDSSGRCIFLDADRRCAIHRQLGPDALASACRDFPRVVTLTPLGVSITLSHYCPTAAAMLFTPRDSGQPGPEGTSLTILENPPAFPPSWPYEGLDARAALPPLLRPGVLMDWPSLERWETFAVSVLGDDARTPEAALDVLAAAAEEARRWTPEDGAFEGHLARVLSSRGASPGSATRGPQCGSTPRADGGSLARHGHSEALGRTEAWSLLADCVPHRERLPPPPEGLDDADARWVEPAWPSLDLPVRRWLAAKAFASWLALQGEGLRTTVHGLRVALAVLRAEAARGCAEAGRTLHAALLEQAIRRADLLLVHLADPGTLASRLGRGERTPARPRPA